MSARVFAESFEQDGPRKVSRYRLVCSRCGCSEALGQQDFGARMAKDIVPKKFGERGWTVGKRPADDLCPACTLADQARRRSKLQVVKTDEAPTADADAANKPREMSRDDRRLIFSKINEVYLDEKTGYSAGWGDARVANDLGVPRAWVAKVRDENFGPAGNEEVTRALEECRAVANEVRAVSDQVAALVKHVAVLSDRCGRIERVAAGIEKAVRG